MANPNPELDFFRNSGVKKSAIGGNWVLVLGIVSQVFTDTESAAFKAYELVQANYIDFDSLAGIALDYASNIIMSEDARRLRQLALSRAAEEFLKNLNDFEGYLLSPTDAQDTVNHANLRLLTVATIQAVNDLQSLLPVACPYP